MLRVTIYPARESVLIVAQTRDRNGHVADASVATDSRYGVSPQQGLAAQSAGPGKRWPQIDVDRSGLFDAVLIENDIETHPGDAAFIEATAELSDPDAARAVNWPVSDPDDDTKTLWMYVGCEFVFRSIFFRLSSPGAWTGAVLDAEYWDGTDWTTMPTLVQGSRLDSLAGLDDQISWERPGNWFPTLIDHQQATVEGSRKVVSRELFWVRLRLSSLDTLVDLPQLAGLWEGDEGAETDHSRWPLVTPPQKLVIARCPMTKDHNPHLSSCPVASRKAPATLGGGMADLGQGDYLLRIPTYYGEDALAKDDDVGTFLVSGQDKNGTAVTVPVSAEGVLRRPGRYRARVYGEVPNRDANVFLADTGHLPVPPDPDLIDPNNPESQFDPSWQPVMTGAVACFDVRLRDAFAHVEVQRNLSTRDVYSMWLKCGERRVPLVNQGANLDYARLVVTDTYTGAVLIDTMDGGKSNVGDALTPLPAPAGNPDSHLFRYTEDASPRKLVDRGQYILTVTIVRGGEAVVSETSVSFFS